MLFFAERFPASIVSGFSNSETQRQFIDKNAAKKGLQNVTVITGDIVDYEFEPESYDLIISVEVSLKQTTIAVDTNFETPDSCLST